MQMSIQTPLLYAVVHIARGMTKTHQSTSLACISFHRVKVSLSLRLAVRTMRTMRITEYHFCLRCRVSCSLPSFRTFLDEFSTNQARMNRPSTKPLTKPEEHSTREQVYQPEVLVLRYVSYQSLIMGGCEAKAPPFIVRRL